MTFTLYIDAEKWRHHLTQTVDDYTKNECAVLPVIKGNGYGVGRTRLAHECTMLSLSRLAVGTVNELEQALRDFAGDVVVLEPFAPQDFQASALWQRLLKVHAQRIIVTIAGPHLVTATQSGVRRVYLEGLTSMNRFGLTPADMDAALREPGWDLSIEGLSLHLPIADPSLPAIATLETSAQLNSRSIPSRALEVFNWLSWYRELSVTHALASRVSISHFTPNDVKLLNSLEQVSTFDVEVRVGTQLWLGEPKALTAKGTVLAVHNLDKSHAAVGYTQADSHGDASVIVVSGGTSHGVALAAPAPATSFRRRGIAIAEGFAQARGKVRSPFSVRGRNLVFAEPPHMHVSMLWNSDDSVKVGDELSCTMRLTTAHFDQVIGLD